VEEDFAALLTDAEPMLMVCTSGSTGPPKRLEFSVQEAVQSARATASAIGITAGMRALLALDSEPIAGRMMLVRTLALGLDLAVTLAASLPARPATGEQFDFAALVPRQVATLVERDPERLARMGVVLIGGGALSPELERQLATFPNRMYHTFGMTETLSHIALRKIGHAESYTLLPGVQINVTERQELVVMCPWASASPLKTHDVVELVGPDQFVWHGRSDFVINSGGVKVHPEAVERVLSAVMGGHAFVVVGVPDADWGERPVLVVEGRDVPDWQSVDFPHPAWRPATALLVTELPRTRTGKVDRPAVARMISETTGR
jgi:O-succinylbenzoic acid--CoA ligase